MSSAAVVQSIYDWLMFSNVDWTERIVIYLFCAGICIASLILRKSVFNDILDKPYSAIASMICGILGIIISYHILENIRYSVGIGIVLMIVGGYVGGLLLGDGEAE